MISNEDFAAAIKKNPISFACVALSVVMIVVIYFRHGLISEAEQVLTQKTADAQKLALNITYSAQLKDQAEAIEAANKAIAARVVRATQLGTNTQYFYTLESETGVKLIDLRQTTPATVAKPGKAAFLPVAFTVAVQSDLKHILEFLRQLENGTHYCRVNAATCTGNSSSRTSPLTLALSLDLLGTP